MHKLPRVLWTQFPLNDEIDQPGQFSDPAFMVSECESGLDHRTFSSQSRRTKMLWEVKYTTGNVRFVDRTEYCAPELYAPVRRRVADDDEDVQVGVRRPRRRPRTVFRRVGMCTFDYKSPSSTYDVGVQEGDRIILERSVGGWCVQLDVIVESAVRQLRREQTDRSVVCSQNVGRAVLLLRDFRIFREPLV